MAFTNAQKVQIYHYMGYANRYFQVYSSLLYAIGVIENDADASTFVLNTITSLQAIDTSIVDAYRRIKADQVGEIKLPAYKEIAILRSEGRRLVNSLELILGVNKLGDVYGIGNRRRTKGSLSVV